MVQGDLRTDGKRSTSVRIRVGDTADLKAREARAKAKELLGVIANGIDPRPKAKQPSNDAQEGEDESANLTLRMAWTRYRDGHMRRKGRSDGTIEDYRDHVERLMADWLDRPLSTLGNKPGLMTERHEKLTDSNGPYIANGCMRTLRAIYNHARKKVPSLPAVNPVTAVDWNAEKRRDTALGLSDLPGWYAELAALDNPVRREFHLFLLLSGHRPDALKQARLEHVDFRSRILHIPKPKGGEIKAFDIPLSRPMIRCLLRVMRIGRVLYPMQARDWLFPADSATGHLIEHKERRAILSKWGNDLRQTYRTIAQTVGVLDLDVHLLMNHSISGVNAGYITRNKLLRDHLRQQQEAISRRLIDGGRPCSYLGIACVPPTWPFLPQRATLSDILSSDLAPAGRCESSDIMRHDHRPDDPGVCLPLGVGKGHPWPSLPSGTPLCTSTARRRVPFGTL